MNTIKMLRHACRKDPTDWVARLALADALEADGQDELGTRERMLAKSRMALEKRQLICAYRADQLLEKGLTACQETEVRKLAGASRCPVELAAGDVPPTFSGREGYYTFRDSNREVMYPGSARAKGHKLDYHPSTRKVTVGALWLASHGLRAAKET